ncbi:diphthamide synthesis protein [archaeon]|nr:diphthamide synthesis protein [archaeon]
MKVAYITAKSLHDVKLTEEALKRLPKGKIGVFTNIQHLHKMQDLLKQLPEAIFAGQGVGCRCDGAKKIEPQVDYFLFVGNGVFHPLQIAMNTEKDVWLWDPVIKKLDKIDEKLVKSYKNKKEASYKNFLMAKNIGILITCKPGQNNGILSEYFKENKMSKALKLKERTDKNYYLFAFDTLLMSDLENFPFIDMWVNTACNRIGDEKPNILEIQDLEMFENMS